MDSVAVREPIPGDAPAGIDVAYEESFQSLKTEINHLGSATGSADYEKIVALGTRILTEQSKDLTAACYLALGLTRTEGYAGLARGLAVVRNLMEAFWDDLYPVARRMRARQNALLFMIERTGDWLAQHKATPDDREAIEAAMAEIEALQAFTMEHMGEDAPAFSGLMRTLREALRRLPAPEPEAPPEPDKPAATSEPAPASSSPSASQTSSTSAPGPSAPGTQEAVSASDAGRVVLRAAAALREANPLDPIAFALVRAVRWGGLHQLPPNESGKTRIPEPPAPRRQALATMLASGNVDTLAREAEVSFQAPPFHFWLDGQRLLAEALGQLGAPAKPALAVVREQAGALIERLPGLAALTFQDGTPFADPMTADWLASLAASGDGAARPADDEALADDLAAAREQLAGGDLASALRTLDAPGAAPSERARRRLAAAELCFKGNRADVARPLLDALDETVRAHGLDAWDPAFALDVLRLRHRTLVALTAAAPAAAKPALKEQADAAFERLCRLDPAAALG